MQVVIEAIANFLEDAQNDVDVSACQCGALTMSSWNSSHQIAFKAENAKYIKPTLEGVFNNCNHCANDWGVDIEEPQEEETKTCICGVEFTTDSNGNHKHIDEDGERDTDSDEDHTPYE